MRAPVDTDFDRYIGIDWSGAAQPGYAGVAVASCAAGRAAPALVPPPGKTWTRAAVLDWLQRELARPTCRKPGITRRKAAAPAPAG